MTIITVKLFHTITELEVNLETTSVLDVKKFLFDIYGYPLDTYILICDDKILKDQYYLKEYGIHKNSILRAVENACGGGSPEIQKVINLKFIIDPKNSNKSYFSIFHQFKSEEELYGLLKFCFLKEISLKIDLNKLTKLPKFIFYILELLKYGYIAMMDPKEEILQFLKKYSKFFKIY